MRKTAEEALDAIMARVQSESQGVNPSFRDLVQLAGLDPAVDFAGSSLRDLDFRDEDLRGFNFAQADLAGCDFRRANVEGASFVGAELEGVIGLHLFPPPDEPAETFNLQRIKWRLVAGQRPEPVWIPLITKLRLGLSGIKDLSPLRDLRALTFLSLKSTPVTDFTPIQDLTSLQTLQLDNTSISDLSVLKQLTQLANLELYYCKKLSNLDPLVHTCNLRHVDISYTGVTDIKPLLSHKSLRFLSISGTDQRNLMVASDFPRLSVLHAMSLPESTDFTVITKCKHLRSLSMGNVGPELSFLADLISVTTLNLQSRPTVSLPDLGHLTELRSIALETPNLLDLEKLTLVPNLYALTLTNMSARDLWSVANIVTLMYLSLRSCRDIDLAPLAKAKRLNTITLENSHVHDLSQLANIPTLSSITFRETQSSELHSVIEALPQVNNVYTPTERWTRVKGKLKRF